MANTYEAPGDWETTLASIGRNVGRATSLEEACAATTQILFEAFPSTVLARFYATVPYERLAATEKAFVDDVADRTGQVTRSDMPVLVLFGTHGVEEAWCDRKQSRGHLAIPLVSAAFVEGIPMLSRLLKELGFDLAWLDEAPELHARKLVGGFNGVFFVDDATRVRDAAGRLVIPAQDFVAAHDVRSVFGMGGLYPDGTLVAGIVFSKETLRRASLDKLKAIITTFKADTFGIVRNRKLFA